MTKRFSDDTVGWIAIAIGLGTAVTPVWMPTSAASAGVTLGLGIASVIYGAWSLIGRRAGGHWPLFAIGLMLTLSPWLAGFSEERAVAITLSAGIALLVIGRMHTSTVAELAAQTTEPTARRETSGTKTNGSPHKNRGHYRKLATRREESSVKAKKHTLATIAAGALAALTIGLAHPVEASAADTRDTQDTTTKVESTQYPQVGQTHYGTYQNKNKRESAHRR